VWWRHAHRAGPFSHSTLSVERSAGLPPRRATHDVSDVWCRGSRRGGAIEKPTTTTSERAFKRGDGKRWRALSVCVCCLWCCCRVWVMAAVNGRRKGWKPQSTGGSRTDEEPAELWHAEERGCRVAAFSYFCDLFFPTRRSFTSVGVCMSVCGVCVERLGA
jgi:hypothetical protein